MRPSLVRPPQANILRWCKTNLSEAFIAWTHLKALRVHAESILTYGLPVNYRAMLIKVTGHPLDPAGRGVAPPPANLAPTVWHVWLLPRPAQYNKKNERRLRDVLLQLYGHLGRADGSGADESIAAQALPGQSNEYYPYVTYSINMDLIK